VGCKPNRTNNNPMRLDMRRPKRSAVNVMAEREGFRVRCDRPLCHLSRRHSGRFHSPRVGRVLGEDGRADKALAG
jgi:hypothetical protein